MKKLSISICLLILISFFACEDKNDPEPFTIDSYPMQVGNEWSYTRELIIDQYDGSQYDTTLFFENSVWIEKDTVLQDTLDVKIFKSRQDNNSFTSDQFMQMENEGLKNYAYRNAGPIVFPKSRNVVTKIFYPFSSGRFIPFDEIIFEDPPTLNIKYPLQSNSEWTYVYPTETFDYQIDKKVMGSEDLSLNGKVYKCFKVKWTFINSIGLDHTEIIDWIAAEGLIKRTNVSDSAHLTDETGATLAIVKFDETMMLTEIDIE